jgi:hypothetical protein
MRYIVSLCFVLFTTPIAYPSDQTKGLDRTPNDAHNLFAGVWQNERGSIVGFTRTKGHPVRLLPNSTGPAGQKSKVPSDRIRAG